MAERQAARAQRMVVFIAVVALVESGGAAVACAQGSVGKDKFLGAGPLWSMDRTWRLDKALEAAGLAVHGGLPLRRHLRVRVELEVPARTTVHEAIDAAGFRERATTRQQMITLSPVIELHGDVAPRLRASLAAGLGMLRRSEETVLSVETLGGDGVWRQRTLQQGETKFTPFGAAVFGAGLGVRLARGYSLEPYVRVFLLPFNDRGDRAVHAGAVLRRAF